MKKSIFMLLIGICSMMAYGMTNDGVHVYGTVVDASGEPVIGATVMVYGTNMGTVTDVDGHFMLIVPSGSSLVVSYVGMKTKICRIPASSPYVSVRIILEEDDAIALVPELFLEPMKHSQMGIPFACYEPFGFAHDCA